VYRHDLRPGLGKRKKQTGAPKKQPAKKNQKKNRSFNLKLYGRWLRYKQHILLKSNKRNGNKE